jgi:hypothetical protein
MKNRQLPLNNEQPETRGLQSRSDTQKPVSSIFVDALSLSRVARAETSQSLVTNLMFRTGGSATIHLKNGQLYVNAKECATTMLDANDGACVVLMLTPEPVAQ